MLLFNVFYCSLLVLLFDSAKIKPKPVCTAGKNSTAELQTTPLFFVLEIRVYSYFGNYVSPLKMTSRNLISLIIWFINN